MYGLNDNQQTLLDRATEIADGVIAEHAQEVDAEARFPRESLDALAAEGFFGLTVPKEFGGMGESPRIMCAILDRIAQHCPSTAMVYKMHLCGASTYVAAGERMADTLRAVAAGEHLSTLAWSEAGSRSQFWAPVSKPTRNGEGLVLHSRKSFVTAAGHADGYVVSTQWVEAESPLQSMLYLVLGDDDGIQVDAPWSGMGMRGNASSPMTFEGVQLEGGRALCEEAKGMDAMLGVVLPVFMLGNSAISVGICERATAATLDHITSARFEHSDSKLADLPNQRARLAQMRIETDRARAHLVSVIESVENPGPMTQLLVLESKASAAEAAVTVTDVGMRACGGAAYGRKVGLERQFRDARASIVMAPTTDHVHEFIGRALCGMELF